MSDDAYEEIKALREEIERLKSKKIDVAEIISHNQFTLDLTRLQVEGLVKLLAPVVNPVDITGKTIVFKIPINGQIQEDVMIRYSAYVDILKKMGAKNAIFLPDDGTFQLMTDDELKKAGLS